MPTGVGMAVAVAAGVGMGDGTAVAVGATVGMGEGTAVAVGATVFDTCRWVGRFEEAWKRLYGVHTFQLVPRRQVKGYVCEDSRAKDANIRAALIDYYGPGKRAAVGLKAAPGPLYGFRADMWAALGVAFTVQQVRERYPRREVAA